MMAFRIGFLILGLLVIRDSGLTAGEGFTNAPIPAPIKDFYEDYNFVSSFSTKQERQELLNRLADMPDPEISKSERLEKVRVRMKRLRNKIWVQDSGMVAGVDKHVKYLGFSFRPVLFSIGKSRVSAHAVTLEIHSYELEPEMILHFIFDYDQNQGDEKRIPSLEERIQRAQAKAPGIEVHRWHLQDGNWMKSGADLFFLEEKD